MTLVTTVPRDNKLRLKFSVGDDKGATLTAVRYERLYGCDAAHVYRSQT